MNLFKTSFLNGIAVAVRIISALLINKILAVYIGPSGFAMIGQFQNVAAIISHLAGGLLAPGVTKMTAQHFDDVSRQYAVWKTAIRLSLFASIFAGAVLMVISQMLSEMLFYKTEMRNVFYWLALSLPALTLNNLLLAIVNGRKEIGVYVLSNIFGSILGLLVTGLLVSNYGLFGAFIALVINPALVVIATISIASRRTWFLMSNFWGEIDKYAIKELAGFGAMGLVTALAGPTVFLIIRDHLTNNFGLTAAGYWQATTKLSDAYLMLVVSTFSVYFLPRIAEIRVASELKSEILKVYLFSMPFVFLCSGIIFLNQNFVISILFSSSFLAMSELLGWQLVGDIIRIGAWVLSFVIAGRALAKQFIFTEILFSSSYVLLTFFFTQHFALKGVVIAYTVNYSCYWVCMLILVMLELRKMQVYRGSKEA